MPLTKKKKEKLLKLTNTLILTVLYTVLLPAGGFFLHETLAMDNGQMTMDK